MSSSPSQGTLPLHQRIPPEPVQEQSTARGTESSGTVEPPEPPPPQFHIEAPSLTSQIPAQRFVHSETSAIRNVAIIGHLGHGKSTVARTFAAEYSTYSSDNPTTSDQKFQGVSTKSTLVSFLTVFKDDLQQPSSDRQKFADSEILVNLFDCPGHPDFSAETTAALRLSDGALVVVDVERGVTAHTEYILRQAASEYVKPSLVVNKIDSIFFKDAPPKNEVLYQSILKIIDTVNATTSTYFEKHPDYQMNPRMEDVVFASASGKWGFTLETFVIKYHLKFSIDRYRFRKYIWGDYYFNPKTRKWSQSQSENGMIMGRAFNQFILNPIFSIYEAVSKANMAGLDVICHKLDIHLRPVDKQKTGADLFETVMQEFLPLKQSLQQVIGHLPSPAVAQTHRIARLYTGDMDDAYGFSLQSCNPAGPLMIYISKMIPDSSSSAENDQYFALGRVFSGTISSGQKVLVEGIIHHPVTVSQPLIMNGQYFEPVSQVSAGNLVAIAEVDNSLLKLGLLTSERTVGAFRSMQLPPVVIQYGIKPQHAMKLPLLVKALRSLMKSDLAIQESSTETGEHVISGVGELHLKNALAILGRLTQNTFTTMNPFSSYRETVTDHSSQIALAKAPNKLSRFYVTAEPLGDELTTAIESRRILQSANIEERTRKLKDDFGWEETDGRKIWSLGSDYSDPNLVVDQTKAVMYLNDIKDAFISGFRWATKEGPVAEEPIRSVRYNIMDVMLQADNTRRSTGQIIPAARRVIYSSTLLATPALMEPRYLVEVQTQGELVNDVQKLLKSNNGVEVFDSLDLSPLPKSQGDCIVKFHVPALNTLGLEEQLNRLSSRKLVYQAAFDHWGVIGGGTPLNPESPAGQVMVEVRRRKGLKTDVPQIKDFLDSL